jgi:hypothetical protein
MSKVAIKGATTGTGTFTIESPATNTDRTLVLPDAAGTVIVGTQPAGDIVGTTATQTLTNKSISGAQINSGTVAVARLGSGTPGTGNFLRGDGSWQTVPASAPSTTDVLNATAGATAGAVGTYAFLAHATIDVFFVAGDTFAGSNLRFTGGGTGTTNGGIRKLSFTGTPSGTWRAMGATVAIEAGNNSASVFLRIS